MSRLLKWIVLPVLLAPSPGAAQAPTPATPAEGQRVRVVARCEFPHHLTADCRRDLRPRMVRGQLRAFGSDTLRVGPEWGGTELVIPTDLVERVWQVDGKKTNFWAGAGIGLFAGALLGGLIGSQVEFCILTCSTAPELGVAIGAPAGFLLGGLIGASIQTDRWREVPVAGAGSRGSR